MARTKRAIDVTGMIFGRLSVACRSQFRPGFWSCVCSCGNKTETTATKLKSGHTRSCGCLTREGHADRGRRRTKDRTGNRYGRWLVVGYAGSTIVTPGRSKSEASWLCRCDCGVEKVVRGGNLHNGSSKSCGCLAREMARVSSRLKFSERWALNSLPRGHGNAMHVYRAYIQSAKKRNLKFELRLDEMIRITSSNCAYCGVEPRRVCNSKRSNGPYTYNGIDRVDNSLGYVRGNMVPCCTRCNSAKQNLPLSEFLGWIARVYHTSVVSKSA